VTSGRRAGIVSVVVAIVGLSLGSTLVKWSQTAGPTVAWWRMLASATVWMAILAVRRRRLVTAAELRQAVVPGMAFGLDLMCFFTGVTHTTVANAEFIAALSPLIVVPAGAALFHEHLRPSALSFGLVSLLGLALVLLTGDSDGEATWRGNALIAVATVLWAVYLLTSRRLRQTMSVEATMASVMLVATLTITPIGVAGGQLGDLTGRSWITILALTAITGSAHGLLVFAQRSVPVGTISLLTVGQPALAVLWSVLILGAMLAPIQYVGMVVVLAGLVLMVRASRRTVVSVPPTTGELAGPAG
jgi:drug/metabolite transporter (DMT)-like permease